MPQLVINNFTRGQLDHDLNGRFELPFYFNGFEVCRNFISNYKGNVKFRTGMEYAAKTKNNQEAVIMEFRFNTEQSYLLEFTEGILRFYTYDANGNFGYVVDDENNIIELNTGITLDQAKKLQKAQNADAMYLTAPGMMPRVLKRTSATSFSIENANPTGMNYDTDGYPSAVAFYGGRLWFGGFANKPLTVRGSEVAEYGNFTVPGSNIDDDDPLSLTLSEITDPIEWLMGGKNNLYVGNPEGICLINGGGYDVPITATEVNADLANKEGASSAAPTQKDSQVFYVSNDKRKVYMFDYDLLTEKFLSNDLNMLSQEVTRGRLKKIYYKRDDNNIIYCLLEDGKAIALLYKSSESINGWFPLETSGNIIDICTITRPDGKDDLFLEVLRNGVYYIEKLANEVEFTGFYETENFKNDPKKEYYNRLIAEQLKQCNYLDGSTEFSALQNNQITFDGVDTITAQNAVFNQNHVGHYVVYKTSSGAEYGYFEVTEYISETQVKVRVASNGYNPSVWNYWYISFNQITGLTDFEGQQVMVVADGGYLNTFTVTEGTLNFDREMTSCVVGYSYEGLLKTFNLGFSANGKNLQTVRKRIVEFILRFVYSAGVNIGTDINDMFVVQYFSPQGFMDLPPLPMDGDEKRQVADTSSEEKYIFLTQDLPLPMNLTMVQYNIEFGS